MQKLFATQPELFVTTRELDHHALDDTEAVLDWSKIERNSQAPQPPTVFFVSFDVSLLCHRVHEFSVVV